MSPHGFDFQLQGVRDQLLPQCDSTNQLNRTPLISNESFASNMFYGGYNRQEITDRLAVVFDNVSVLIVVREQRAMIRSLYKTLVFLACLIS